MSKILADQIANYDDNGPIEIKEGLNISSGKPIQIAGSAGSNGNVLVSDGTTVSWSNALDNSGNWDTAFGWGNHASGGYLTSLGDAAGVTTAKINNWDEAHGWGDHSAAGYITSDNNTTYVQSAVADGSNVDLRLTGSDGTNDDILLTAGTNVTFSSVTANGFTIDVATGGSPANLGINATARVLYQAGNGVTDILAAGTSGEVLTSGGDGVVPSWTSLDLQAVTDAGISTNNRLQIQNSGTFAINIDPTGGITTNSGVGIKIGNGGTNVWECEIDGSNGNIETNGDITCNSLLTGNSSIAITDTGTNGNIAFNTDGTDRWKITSGGHIIPYTNAAFDIGNAEYKVRHLFLSDNSLWIGENTRVSITPPSQAAFQANNSVRPVVKFYNRNKYRVPKPIEDAGGTLAGCITHIQTAFPGRPGFINADTLKLNDFLHYWCALTGSPNGTYSVDDLYPSEISAGDLNPNYWPDDWSDTFYFGQNGQNQAIDINSDADALKLSDSDHFIRNNVSGDFVLKIEGTAGDENGASIEKTFFEIVVWVDQDASPQTISGMTVDGDAVGQITINGTPEASKLQTFKIRGMFLSGLWRATVELI